MNEFLEKLEASFPGHVFSWEKSLTQNLEPVSQLMIDGEKMGFWAFPEKLTELITGGKETADDNFNKTFATMTDCVTKYLAPLKAKSADAPTTA